MTIKFLLLVNKQGQTRLAKYTDQSISVEERRALEGEIVRKCLARSDKQVCNVAILRVAEVECLNYNAICMYRVETQYVRVRVLRGI